jgi:hypothetical protein
MALAKAFLKTVIVFGLSFLLFRWVSFTTLQSLLLAALVEAGFEAYLTLNAKATTEEYFSPYTVIVCPKFDQILLDYKILKNDDEVRQLYDLWRKKDQRLIGFTVLKLRPSGDWLIYHDQDRCFLGSVDFEEPIQAIAFSGGVFDRARERNTVYLRDPTNPEIGFATDSPQFYFRQSSGGYELGLKVPHDWWTKICDQNPSAEFRKAKADTDHRFGTTRVPVITVPHIAFGLFRLRYDDYENSRKLWDAIDEVLPKFGWTRVKHEDSEISDPWIRLESKYFDLQYKEI